MTSSRSTSGVVFFCFLFTFASPAAAFCASDPPARQPGLWDFALKKINPANIDYGAEFERRRQTWLRRFGDSRLWTEACELGLMLSGWALVVAQRREKLRREIITSELLAQYHNALAESRIRLQQAIADNTALGEAAQAVIPSAPLPAVDHSVSPAELYLGSNFSPQRSLRPAANATPAFETSARLAALEQQLSESRAREKLLEKELEKIPVQHRSAPLSRAAATSPRGKTSL